MTARLLHVWSATGPTHDNPGVRPGRRVRIDHPGRRNAHRDGARDHDHRHAEGEPDGRGVLAASGASLAYAVLRPLSRVSTPPKPLAPKGTLCRGRDAAKRELV